MTKTVIVTILAVTMLATGANAQLAKGEMVMSANAGFCVPMGDFGDDKGDDAGGAKTNFTIGGELDYGLSSTGLSLISGVSIMRNGFDDDALDLNASIKVDAGTWYNIPIMSGVKYEKKVSPTMALYGQFQLAFNYFRPPSADLTQGQGTGEIEADSGTSFGFVIGGGVVFNDRFTANLRLLSLGKPDVESTFSSGGQSQTTESEIGISMLTLTGGMRF